MVQAPFRLLSEQRLNDAMNVASDAPDRVTRPQRGGVQADQAGFSRRISVQERNRGGTAWDGLIVPPGSARSPAIASPGPREHSGVPRLGLRIIRVSLPAPGCTQPGVRVSVP